MSDNTSHFEVERGSERSFGIVFALVFSLISVFPLFFDGTLIYWALALAIVFALTTWLYPRVLKPLNFLWFKLGMLLGMIIAPLVMMLIYFLVVTPTGLLMRLFRKDLLRMKKDPQQNSYWINRAVDDDQISSMKNQF